MWVAPDARGLGLAQRMLEALEGHAASMGLHTLRLDNNRSLAEARALYLRNGYREGAPYNDNPYADHRFQKDGLTASPAKKAVQTHGQRKKDAPAQTPHTATRAAGGEQRTQS